MPRSRVISHLRRRCSSSDAGSGSRVAPLARDAASATDVESLPHVFVWPSGRRPEKLLDLIEAKAREVAETVATLRKLLA